ncbi:MAG TPA: DUF4351 domain-containing protein, partial [Desulfobacterales bacterium]|nr:DUF4351 domain-containing protein [Desulfobacterales bacterium]
VKEWNKESMERGLRQGMQKGATQLLIRMLEKKFGALPQEFVLRLEQADEEQIIGWSERILSAHTLGDVFGH